MEAYVNADSSSDLDTMQPGVSDHLKADQSSATRFERILPVLAILFTAAAALLVSFSHITDILRTNQPTYYLPDPVFPFLSGKQVYGGFSLILIAYSICCVRASTSPPFYPNAQIACGLILTSLLLYRSSLHYLGVGECNCLGIIGRALSLSKKSEPVARWILFGALALPLLPLCLKWCRIILPRPAAAALVGIALLHLAPVRLEGGDSASAVDIYGKYSLTFQSTTNAAPVSTPSKGHYVARRSGSRYTIQLTDDITGQVSGQWFDGKTACYFDFRNGNDFNTNRHFRAPETGLAILKSGNWFVGAYSTKMPTYLIWLMFGASKESVETVGVQERPLPWGQGRYSLRAYGYAWQFNWMEGSQFLETAIAARDVSLDLPTFKEEITRPTLSFPFPSSLQRERRIDLEGIRYRVPDKLLESSYKSLTATNLSGQRIPTQSELSVYWHDGILARQRVNYPYPYLVATAAVESVRESTAPLDFTFNPPDARNVEVGDSRPSEIRNNRYYAGPIYTVHRSESVRDVDDHRTLEEKAAVLSEGPQIVWDGRESIHSFIWSGYLSVLVFGGIAFVSRLKKQNIKHKNITTNEQ